MNHLGFPLKPTERIQGSRTSPWARKQCYVVFVSALTWSIICVRTDHGLRGTKSRPPQPSPFLKQMFQKPSRLSRSPMENMALSSHFSLTTCWTLCPMRSAQSKAVIIRIKDSFWMGHTLRDMGVGGNISVRPVELWLFAGLLPRVMRYGTDPRALRGVEMSIFVPWHYQNILLIYSYHLSLGFL